MFYNVIFTVPMLSLLFLFYSGLQKSLERKVVVNQV